MDRFSLVISHEKEKTLFSSSSSIVSWNKTNFSRPWYIRRHPLSHFVLCIVRLSTIANSSERESKAVTWSIDRKTERAWTCTGKPVSASLRTGWISCAPVSFFFFSTNDRSNISFPCWILVLFYALVVLGVYLLNIFTYMYMSLEAISFKIWLSRFAVECYNASQ